MEKKHSEGEKYALVRPVDVGLSSEDHYSVKTGLKDGELIVTGRFRVLSKELQHGMKVKYEDETSSIRTIPKKLTYNYLFYGLNKPQRYL